MTPSRPPLDPAIPDKVLEDWTGFFADKERTRAYSTVRWSTDKFVVMKATSDANDQSKFKENVQALLDVALLMQARFKSRL